MVIDNYRKPSAAELYAQQFQSSVAQVTVDDSRQFVLCGEQCPGATPKTSVATLNTAIVQRARAAEREKPPAVPFLREERPTPTNRRKFQSAGADDELID